MTERTTYEPAPDASPCPCCGNRDVRCEAGSYGRLFSFYCGDVAACGLRQSGFATREEALAAWNRRARTE